VALQLCVRANVGGEDERARRGVKRDITSQKKKKHKSLCRDPISPTREGGLECTARKAHEGREDDPFAAIFKGQHMSRVQLKIRGREVKAQA